MSHPRYDWWGYAKSMIKRYPDKNTENERQAVDRAIAQTKEMENGSDRMAVVRMVLIKKTHTIAGAALQIHCCERNAQQWHADFIRLVAKEFECHGLF